VGADHAAAIANDAARLEVHHLSRFERIGRVGAFDDFGGERQAGPLDAIRAHRAILGQIGECRLEVARETHAWLREYRTFLEQTKPGSFTVGEIFDANPTSLVPYYPDQLDEYFAFDAGDKIISAANTGQALGFTLSIANTARQLPFQRWAPFLTHHDQQRAMTTLGNDVSKAKIAATALLTLPGLPFVYYGEEIGMLGAKPDEQIRNPLQWTADETTGGFTTGKPWEALQKNYKEVNIAAQNADPASLLNLYRRLIHLHTQHPALAQGSFVPLKSSSTALSAFVRKAAGETVLVVLNFGKDAVGGATLSLEASDLAPGTYRAAPLLGDQPGARLTVGAGGVFTQQVAGTFSVPAIALQGTASYRVASGSTLDPVRST
jgi:glycosidase